MRTSFARWIESVAESEKNLVFLTGDLGFNALEGVRDRLGQRFVNVGVCEQNMVSIAAGLARQGFKPFVYSIAPFAVLRAAEQLRLDCGLHRLPVKIVGNGGGYHYGNLGASHHALEDIGLMSSLPHFRAIIPLCDGDVDAACAKAWSSPGPIYLRLGKGELPSKESLPPFAPMRRIRKGEKVTIVGVGPILISALAALDGLEIQAEVFAVSEVPLIELDLDFISSLKKTQKLLVIEEHVERGGIAEHLSKRLAEIGIPYRLAHACSMGYPSGRYGSQDFHRQESGLDPVSLARAVLRLISMPNDRSLNGVHQRDLIL